MAHKVLIIGGGLAGSEAAYYLATHQVEVVLAEAKLIKLNPAQSLPDLAELVCSNSLKSNNPHSAHGILKQEMRALGSLILQAADACAVPAAESLAVDRKKFAQWVTEKIKHHPRIKLVAQEVTNPLQAMQDYGCDFVLIAAGPLATAGLSQWLKSQTGEDFYFYDAIAPIVDAHTLDYSVLYFKDRYHETQDFLNLPLNKEEYLTLVQDLVAAEKVPSKNFEKEQFYEGCLPIDLMAERGVDTLRYACLKPVGLEMPNGQRPYAVIQLRRENLLGEAYNLVGFQTRLKYGEQKRIFQKLPGLKNAEFLRYGSVHRNSYLAAAHWLNYDLSLYHLPQVRLVGQIMGVEGYTESAAMGLYGAIQLERQLRNCPPLRWPTTTAIGALLNYVQAGSRAVTSPSSGTALTTTFNQHPAPSNINFGLLPPLADLPSRKLPKKEKQARLAARAAQAVQQLAAQIMLLLLLVGGWNMAEAHACVDYWRPPRMPHASWVKQQRKQRPLLKKVRSSAGNEIQDDMAAAVPEKDAFDLRHPFGEELANKLMKHWFSARSEAQADHWLHHTFAYPLVKLAATPWEKAAFFKIRPPFARFAVELIFPQRQFCINVDIANNYTDEEQRFIAAMVEELLSRVPLNPYGIKTIRVWHYAQAQRPAHLVTREDNLAVGPVWDLLMPVEFLQDNELAIDDYFLQGRWKIMNFINVA